MKATFRFFFGAGVTAPPGAAGAARPEPLPPWRAARPPRPCTAPAAIRRRPPAPPPPGEPLAVPVHSRLERVLVRRRAEAELALRLRVLVRPPLAREADLLQADRPAATGCLREPQRHARREPQRGWLASRQAAQVGEEAVERVVAIAEDV